MVLRVNTRLRAFLNSEHRWEFRAELIHAAVFGINAAVSVSQSWVVGKGGIAVLVSCSLFLVPFPVKMGEFSGRMLRERASLRLEEGLSS